MAGSVGIRPISVVTRCRASCPGDGRAMTEPAYDGERAGGARQDHDQHEGQGRVRVLLRPIDQRLNAREPVIEERFEPLAGGGRGLPCDIDENGREILLQRLGQRRTQVVLERRGERGTQVVLQRRGERRTQVLYHALHRGAKLRVERACERRCDLLPDPARKPRHGRDGQGIGDVFDPADRPVAPDGRYRRVDTRTHRAGDRKRDLLVEILRRRRVQDRAHEPVDGCVERSGEIRRGRAIDDAPRDVCRKRAQRDTQLVPVLALGRFIDAVPHARAHGRAARAGEHHRDNQAGYAAHRDSFLRAAHWVASRCSTTCGYTSRAASLPNMQSLWP